MILPGGGKATDMLLARDMMKVLRGDLTGEVGSRQGGGYNPFVSIEVGARIAV